jgi:cytochrome P450
MSRIEVEGAAAAAPAAERAAAAIVAQVGDVGRPVAGIKPNAALGHLPGEDGLLLGAGNVLRWMRHGVRHLVEQYRRFGPVYRTRFGPDPVVSVVDPDLMLQVLRNEDGAYSTALAWWTYFGGLDRNNKSMEMTVTLDFEPHREARRLLQPAFTPAATAGYLEILAPMLEAAIAEWQARGRVLFKPEIRRLLATVSSRVFLGADREGALLDSALRDLWGAPLALAKHRWLSRTWRRASAGYRRLYDALLARVPERRASGGKDLFSQLCVASRDEVGLADATLVHLMIGVLLGAFDTTASGLASMAYLLCRHPEWQERLRRESQALGSARLAHADARRLESCELAWKETLRLFPVTAHLPRCTLRDVELGGHKLPAGTYVHLQMPPLMQDPRWWSEPQRFDPERFLPGRAEDRAHRAIYMPFGGGAHACLGVHLAGFEVKAFWHALLTRCRLRLAPDYAGSHGYRTLGAVSGDVGVVLVPLAG